MLRYAMAMLLVAGLAGVLGFAANTPAVAGPAKLASLAFAIGAFLTLLMTLNSKRTGSAA